MSAGCSVVESFQKAGDAQRAIEEGKKSAEDKDIAAALKSYLKAESLLNEVRANRLEMLASDKEMARLKQLIEEMEKEAETEGFVRVDGRYVDGEELEEAIAGSIKEMLKNGQFVSFQPKRIVVDEVLVSDKKTADSKHDISIDLVLRDTDEEGKFSQEAWATVRFVLDGAFGHGFSYYLARRFPRRPWMGVKAAWGVSDKSDTESHFIGLKDKIARLSVSINRGRYRQRAPAEYGRYGFESLQAVGPYWEKEFFKSYTLDGSSAKQCNWEQPSRIPDATLHKILRIDNKRSKEE